MDNIFNNNFQSVENNEINNKYIKGVTSTGFIFVLDKKRLNNYELIELLAEIETRPHLIPKLLKLFLGDEQTARLKEHLREDDGTIPNDKISNEIANIFNTVQSLKN